MISVSLSREQGPECFLVWARGIENPSDADHYLGFGGWSTSHREPFLNFYSQHSLYEGMRRWEEISVSRDSSRKGLPLAPDYLCCLYSFHAVFPMLVCLFSFLTWRSSSRSAIPSSGDRSAVADRRGGKGGGGGRTNPGWRGAGGTGCGTDGRIWKEGASRGSGARAKCRVNAQCSRE